MPCFWLDWLKCLILESSLLLLIHEIYCNNTCKSMIPFDNMQSRDGTNMSDMYPSRPFTRSQAKDLQDLRAMFMNKRSLRVTKESLECVEGLSRWEDGRKEVICANDYYLNSRIWKEGNQTRPLLIKGKIVKKMSSFIYLV